MPDFIPAPDPDFHDWVVPFNAYVNTNMATLGLTATDVAPLTAAVNDWTVAYPAHKTAAAAATGAKTTKDQARAAIEGVARPLVQQLQASNKVTDAQRSQMKITVRSTTRTPVSIPVTAPMATVDTSQRLQHTIDFRDSTSPGSRKKPAGVAGCEIWSKVGAPAPTDVSQMAYLATDTATPYLAQYTGAQAGQMVYYWLRWVNTRGEKGPWSEPVSATISG
jgi:predicted phage tail protein